MKKAIYFVDFIAVITIIIFYLNLSKTRTDSNYELESFFGETLTVISSNRPEGYAVSILKNEDICLCRLQRGDSINCYLELPDLPSALHDYAPSTGTITAQIDIPTRTSLEGDLFFMDVDFDDERS